MNTLKDKVAVVTGASRGIGKGIALALGHAGATVYVTGRTQGDGERTIDTTARLVTENGGDGRAIRCDHGVDEQIGSLFEQIKTEAGKIDLLVNNVYKIPDPPAWGGGFWIIRCRSGTTKWVSACGRITWQAGSPRLCCSRPGRGAPFSTFPPPAARVTTSPAPMAPAKPAWIGSQPIWPSN